MLQDVPLFEGIVQDLFPSETNTIMPDSALEAALKKTMQENNLQVTHNLRCYVSWAFEDVDVMPVLVRNWLLYPIKTMQEEITILRKLTICDFMLHKLSNMLTKYIFFFVSEIGYFYLLK